MLKWLPRGFLLWVAVSVVFADRLGRIDTLLLTGPLVIVPLGLRTLTRQTWDRALPFGGCFAVVAIVARAGGTERRTFAVTAAAFWLATVVVPAPMLLALHYAASRATSVTPLPYETIALIHGTLNAIGFVGVGLWAAHFEQSGHRAQPA